jgi:type I restriction enzyme S subunit
MKLETFFEKFDLFADAPDVVEKMRKLVLAMAVQGRLVEQSSADGSADALLMELTKGLSPGFDCMAYQPNAAPLQTLPRNWRWAPTRLLCDLQTGKRMKGGALEKGVISLGGEHLKPNGLVDYSVPRYVSKEFYDEMTKGKVCVHDTLMVKDGATTGKVAFVSQLPSDGLAAVNEHVFILRWREPIVRKLAFYFMRAFAHDYIATKSAGLIGGIRREAVLEFPFPLPPLAEQTRIVAKVDELMALCDRLEQQQQQREEQASKLARASLARFAESPTPASLDFFFHKSYDITPADLRKSILTLAVQGKLVPQDPNDEPAEELIKVIANQKERLFKQRLIPNPSKLPPIRDGSVPFDLPKSWQWLRLESICELITKGSSPNWQGVQYVDAANGILFITSENVGNYVLRKMDDPKYVERKFNEMETRSILQRNDLLVNLVGASIGRSAIYDRDDVANINQAVGIIRLVRGNASVDRRYLLHYLNSPTSLSIMFDEQVETARANLSLTNMKHFLVPIPPLAEQRRIVAKVDELMALVDALETQLATAHTNVSALLDAVVHELTNGGATHAVEV